jgi:hypothetical protein
VIAKADPLLREPVEGRHVVTSGSRQLVTCLIPQYQNHVQRAARCRGRLDLCVRDRRECHCREEQSQSANEPTQINSYPRRELGTVFDQRNMHGPTRSSDVIHVSRSLAGEGERLSPDPQGDYAELDKIAQLRDYTANVVLVSAGYVEPQGKRMNSAELVAASESK